MAHVVVLFNLRDGVDPAAYEQWALNTDIPTVRNLSSVSSFRVFGAEGLLGGGSSPYQYVEIIEVDDVNALAVDVQSDQMKQIAAAFAEFADDPTFIVTHELGG